MATATSPLSRGRIVVIAGLFVLVLGVSAGAAFVLRAAVRGPGTTVSATPPLATTTKNRESRRGRLVYETSCSSCHGPDGHGDGPAAPGLKQPPRDLASAPWKYGSSPDAVRRIIFEGIPGTGMRGVGDTLTASELEAVVSYVLTFAPASESTDRLSPELRAVIVRAGLSPVESLRPAPALDLCDVEGRRLALTDLRGKVVLVQFWETTCVPCLGKLPGLETLAEKNRERGLVVLAVCLDEQDGDRLRTVAGRHLKRLPTYRDVGGSARTRYDVSAVPHVALIDRTGQLVAFGTGPTDWNDFSVTELLDTLTR